MGLGRHLPPIALMIAILAVAVWVRVPTLSDRPMHPDEAVQAMRTLLLIETGRFDYDPSDLHGPTLYYIAAAVAVMVGKSTPESMDESVVRAIPFAAGLAVVVLPLLFQGLGWVGRIAASALLATCSAMAFYSTMFFHEMLHVLFCWSFLLVTLRWITSEGRSAAMPAALSGLLLGLCIATKETWIIFVTCALVIVPCFVIFDPQSFARWRASLSSRITALFLVAMVIPPLLLFTNFLQSPMDIWKPFAAPFHYLNKVDGVSPSGFHRNPVTFFLSRVTWYHSGPGPSWFLATPLLLGVAGFALSLRGGPEGSPKSAPLVAVGATSLLMLLIHLLIPYKTPWLLLLPLFGLYLASAHALEAAWKATSRRVALRVLLALSFLPPVAFLARQAHQANSRFANDPRNPWVYSAASHDVTSLSDRIHEATSCVEGPLRVDVWASDYWPLPWYLRDLSGVAWWTSIPDAPPAPLVVMNVEQEPGLAAILLELGYERQYFGIRNEVPVALYIDPMILSCLRTKWSERSINP